MKRIIIIIILITIIMISCSVITVYGFENDIYKIDLPDDYESLSTKSISAFVKNESDGDIGICIYSIESIGLKKDFSTMSKYEVKELLGTVMKDDIDVVETNKEKLGKSKAIKARVKDDDSYFDFYIVTSNKHILLIAFSAPTIEELDNEEFAAIKKSFKMKEWSTNATLVKFGLGALAVGGFVLKQKRYLA